MALTPEQTEELQKTVEQRSAALLAEIRRDMSKVREDRLADLVGPAGDSGDQSVASLISDLDQADASRDILELRTLEAARQRLADGSYGTCIDCGQDIGYERLRANPGAVRCIHCQTRFEKTHASPGGSTI
jgi:DnaK suppressor protein